MQFNLKNQEEMRRKNQGENGAKQSSQQSSIKSFLGAQKKNTAATHTDAEAANGGSGGSADFEDDYLLRIHLKSTKACYGPGNKLRATHL